MHHLGRVSRRTHSWSPEREFWSARWSPRHPLNAGLACLLANIATLNHWINLMEAKSCLRNSISIIVWMWTQLPSRMWFESSGAGTGVNQWCQLQNFCTRSTWRWWHFVSFICMYTDRRPIPSGMTRYIFPRSYDMCLYLTHRLWSTLCTDGI